MRSGDDGQNSGVNPARAGMIPDIRVTGKSLLRKPRASGDDPRVPGGVVLVDT